MFLKKPWFELKPESKEPAAVGQFSHQDEQINRI
jgi:hypothetical protein